MAWLALFALVCQFAISFGHVHLGKAASQTGWAIAADAGKVSTDPSAPPRKNPGGAADQFCAICASINLSAAVVFLAVVAILLPQLVVRRLSWSYADIEPSWRNHALFQPRGPPLV
jgi:Protein of unknown function (DUF2946)